MRTLTLFLVMLLSGCEGFKVLTIYNTSEFNAKVTVKPSLDKYEISKISDYPYCQNTDSTIVVLRPDSSMILVSKFTGLLFNLKLNENDLKTDYLMIETEKDTIIANSKKEIIALLKDNKTKYNRRTNESGVIYNGKNLNCIIISD